MRSIPIEQFQSRPVANREHVDPPLLMMTPRADRLRASVVTCGEPGTRPIPGRGGGIDGRLETGVLYGAWLDAPRTVLTDDLQGQTA